MQEKKEFFPIGDGLYQILVPVYYRRIIRPAWKKYFTGEKEEAEAIFAAAPDFLIATDEEEKEDFRNAINILNFHESRRDYRADIYKKAYVKNEGAIDYYWTGGGWGRGDLKYIFVPADRVQYARDHYKKY